MRTVVHIPLHKAKNIGPTIANKLSDIGIFSLADLQEVTPVEAFKKLSKANPEKHLPVCYYLYSLQGALLDMHWDEIPTELKDELRRQVEGE